MSEDPDDGRGSDRPESGETAPTTVRHDWNRQTHVSVAIVRAVAAATGQEPTALPPLQETIEADALGRLLDGQSSSVVVSFRYAETDVSVTADGNIEVRIDGPPQGEDE